MSSAFYPNKTILVVVLPFGDGVGLVSYNSGGSSLNFRESHVLPISNNRNCIPAFFRPYIFDSVPFYGYCLDLEFNRVIDNIAVHLLFKGLKFDRSSLQFSVSTNFTLEGKSLLSNFVLFPENGSNTCFQDSPGDKGRIVFLHNSDIIVYPSIQSGGIDVLPCSGSEPRLQRLGSECKLAAYGNETTVLINISESFNIVTHVSNECGGNIFLCSSIYYVCFMNASFSVHNVSSGEQISGFVHIDAETLLLGDCLISEDQFYFVAALNDARTVLISFTDHSSLLLGENVNSMLVPYKVVDKLVFVNDKNQSLVYNWTRMCTGDHIAIPSNFDLVHSFTDQNIAKECRCVEITTNQVEPATFTTPPIDIYITSSVTIELPTNSSVDTTPTTELPTNFSVLAVSLSITFAFITIGIIVTILLLLFAYYRQKQVLQ